MRLVCPAFKERERIPDHYTCIGEDVNPELRIEDIPKEAESLVLMINDPDSIGRIWLHWLVYDIPVADTIEEDSVPGKQGMNTFGKTRYGGPCPGSGTHRYVFSVYALDTILGLEDGAEKRDVEKAMEGHILATAELTGLYSKPPVPDKYREIHI